MSAKYLLDASALLALLQDEPGADFVEKRLSSSAISAINLAEVASVLNRGMQEAEIQQLFDALDLPVIVYDQEVAIATGGIRKMTMGSGLSLGDRACLMTAKKYQYIVVTGDKAWLEYQALLAVKIELVR